MKTILRYPGGKTRAIETLLPFIPADTAEICSPFFGGGSFEFALASCGIRVHGYDSFDLLANFWQCVMTDSERIATLAAIYHPLSRDKFYELQRTVGSFDTFERAAVFYVLNRASYSGATLSGGMSPDHPRFTLSSLERLRSFSADNVTVEYADFHDSLAMHPYTFIFADPPYANGESLYGVKGSKHKTFDHAGLAEILLQRGQWIMTYNDCESIRALYAQCRILPLRWVYGMGNDKRSNEILILSDDIIIPK